MYCDALAGGLSRRELLKGSLAVAGFLAVNRTLALLPAGTMLMGFFFLLRAMLAHAVRMIRLKVAKRRWEGARARIQEQIGLV